MILPKYVLTCVDALENAGFCAYAVGGCVRDSLLGLTPHDYDLCTDATPEQMKAVFSDYRLVLAGEKHGTVAVVMDDQLVEITTFRTEGQYSDNRHPDWVAFVSDIESDLARRDFTVNAMAYSPYRGFADPFGGRQDLQTHCLRAVGDPVQRFTEDALRILRGVRFSVRYQLAPEADTLAAMFSQASLMEQLARERVFDELCKLLPLVSAEDICRFSPVLFQVIPELAPMENFDQRSPYHEYDLLHHTAHVVQAVPPELPLRWAALLHDIGKPGTFFLDAAGRGHFPGHAKLGAQIANDILLRLKAPTALRQQVVMLIEHHMTPFEPDRKLLRRRLGKFGTDACFRLLALQRADFCSKGTGEQTDHFTQIDALLRQLLQEEACLRIKDLAINGQDLLKLGFTAGPAIGRCLDALLAMVQEERITNTPQQLLDAAKAFLSSSQEVSL